MWITKLQLKHDDCPIVNRCQKYKLIVFSYPSTWYEKNGTKFATTTCYFQSSDEIKKKKFIEDLKKDKRISQFEISGDMFTYEINLGKKGEHVMLYHTKQIFFAKPVMNHFDGHEYWEVASWNKHVLLKFISSLEMAYEKGYYTYPRQISIKGLAKIAKLGISTFQEHLRKAELKMLPVIIEYQKNI